MTNKAFSALLFSAVQCQIDTKDLHLFCSSTLASLQDWNIFVQVLPQNTQVFLQASLSERQETLTSGHFDLVWKRERACSCTQALSLSLLPWSQVSIRCLCAEEQSAAVPLWAERSLFRGTAESAAGTRAGLHRRAGCKSGHPRGTMALIFPFSPAFLERIKFRIKA